MKQHTDLTPRLDQASLPNFRSSIVAAPEAPTVEPAPVTTPPDVEPPSAPPQRQPVEPASVPGPGEQPCPHPDKSDCPLP